MPHSCGAFPGGIALRAAPGCARGSLLRPRRPRAPRSAALSPEGSSSVHGSHLPRRAAGRSPPGGRFRHLRGTAPGVHRPRGRRLADLPLPLPPLARRVRPGTGRYGGGRAPSREASLRRLLPHFRGAVLPPESSLPAPRGALPAALRQCFCAEQRGALAYLAAAEECSDPALCALYQELSRDEARHAQLLRELVEEL